MAENAPQLPSSNLPSQNTSSPQSTPPQFRPPQFSIATMLLITCCLSVAFAVLGGLYRAINRSDAITTAIFLVGTLAAPLGCILILSLVVQWANRKKSESDDEIKEVS